MKIYNEDMLEIVRWRDSLYEDFHKANKRREKRRIAVFKMQALARGYVVRTAQRAAPALGGLGDDDAVTTRIRSLFAAMHPAEVVDLASPPATLAVARNTVRPLGPFVYPR